MKAMPATNWNSLVERLVATLEHSREVQRKFTAEVNAEAIQKAKERIIAAAKPRRGRPPARLDLLS